MKSWPPKQIKNILFDWSGTLFNDFDASFVSTKATLKNFGCKKFSKDDYRNHFELPVTRFYKRFLGPKIDIAQIDKEYFSHFYHQSKKATLFKPVPSILRSLHQAGIKLFIYSTVRPDILERHCRDEGIIDCFDGIVGGLMDKKKCLPDFIKKNKLQKNETLFVGDMEHDVDSANHAGVLSGAFLCGYHSQDKLVRASPDFVWPDHESFLRFVQRAILTEKFVDESTADYNKKFIHPIPTVGALIFNGENIFLIQTHKWGHTFGIPGGKIEYGEPMEKACKREIWEETGLRIDSLRPAMVQDSIHSKEFYKKGKHFLLINFLARATSTHFKLNDEAESGLWIRPELALNYLRLNTPTKILIESYLSSIL